MFQESIRTYGDQHALGLRVIQCGNVQLSQQLLPTIFQVLGDCVTLYSSANEINLKVHQCNIYIHFTAARIARPGSGKTLICTMIFLKAVSKGLNCSISCLSGERVTNSVANMSTN